MIARIAHRLAIDPSVAPCSRCLDVLELAAGGWHAVEYDDAERRVCDRCARRDDADGFGRLEAWRRMAAGPRRTAA